MIGRRVVDWLVRYRALMSAALIGAVAVSLAVLFIRRPEPPRIVVQQPAVRPTASPPIPSQIVVQLSGEVIAPGVYRLPVGARIDDALRAAGGATVYGDIRRLNLAARLADGQQIVVPKRVDPILATIAELPTPAQQRVNLNTASVAELDRLPGVGPVTAQRIVAYREQHGSFVSVDQLRQANLVSAATFEKIKDLVGI